MTEIQKLQERLRVLRYEADEYARDLKHDARALLDKRSECAALWGAIECVKRGDVPVSAKQRKSLD